MRMILNGQKRDASNGTTIEVMNPATMEVIDTIPCATKEDVDEAVANARTGQKIWNAVPLYKRAAIIQKFTELLNQKRDEFAPIMCSESGKTLVSCYDEVDACINIFNSYCEKARNFGGEVMPVNSEARVDGDIIMSLREPLGVVVSTVPFNYPTELYAHKVAPALITGNAVIVKPASETPLGNIILTELLLEAGVPHGALQILTGNGSSLGPILSSHPDVDVLSLTGSTRVGIDTAVAGAQNLTRVLLELGGNDPLIIFEDADLDKAVAESLAGRASNAGQTCCGSKRFIVHNKVRKDYEEKLVEALKKIKVGNPLEEDTYYGPLISERAAINVEQDIQYTLSQGASLLYGGKRFEHTFIEPTVITNVTKDMDVAKDLEIFGPVFPVIGFDTMEEAIEIANSSCYGLSSGVMTADTSVALKVATQIESGTCVINGCGNYRSAHLPFGGYKMTGLGREGVTETLNEYTQIKNIAFKGLL